MKILSVFFGRSASPAAQQAAATPASPPAIPYIFLDRALRDYSGYTRQAALERCAELRATEFAPHIVVRLNDWVPQVRQAAQRALLALMPSMTATQRLSLLPSLRLLRGAGRKDSQWLAQFEHLLADGLSSEEAVKAVLGDDIKLARATFQVLQEKGSIDVRPLLPAILASTRDIVLALQAIRLCPALPMEIAKANYGIGLASPFGPVRTYALRHLLGADANAEQAGLATDALLDPQYSVRAVAYGFLRQHGVDLAGFYADGLRGGGLAARKVQVALSSLASLRASGALPLITTFTAAPHSAVRTAAYASWLKLAPQDKDGIALQALHDDAASVRKFSLHTVIRQGAYLPYDTVRTLLEARRDYSLLLSFAQRGKWTWLECLARLSTTAEASLHPVLVDSMQVWSRTAGGRFDAATPQQAAFLTSSGAVAALTQLAPGNRTLAFELAQLKQGC